MLEQQDSVRPAADDRMGWRAYWDALGQPWRTEPEIRRERQQVLAQKLARSAEVGQGESPFANMRLDRADVEWLLATHSSRGMQGPVDLADSAQRLREGIQLAGVDLRQAQLSGLPLTRINLSNARLDRAHCTQTHLEHANLANSQLSGANFTKAWLVDASLRQATVQDANLTEAHLESANMYQANCRGASLYIAHLEGAYIGHADFGGATISRAFVDAATSWNDAVLWNADGVAPCMADVRWGDANLGTVDWSKVRMLGDEQEARSHTDRTGQPKMAQKWQDNYRRAVRANRQLAVALRGQGMNEEADRFAYRAQICQRALYRRQGKVGAFLGSGFLALLAGYGYKPLRTLLVYLVVILGYASAFYLQGAAILSPTAALIFSITSFHGRGFFPGGLALDAPITIWAATEAIIGLIIEVSFIATFTQRFFAR